MSTFNLVPVARRILAIMLAAVLCFILLAMPPNVFAQTPDEVPEPSLDPMFENYSKMMNISYEEAQRRLHLQSEMVAPGSKIEATETTFAGSWIEHEPEFGMVVALATLDADKVVSRCLEGVPCAEDVRTVVANKTLVALRADLHRVHDTLLAMILPEGLITGLGLEIPSGRVRILTSDESALRTQLDARSFYEKVALTEVDVLFQYKEYAAAPESGECRRACMRR